MQVLYKNPGFDSASLQIPRSSTPQPGPLSKTNSRLCKHCQEFFDLPPRVWTGSSSEFRKLVDDKDGLFPATDREYAVACTYLHSIRDLVQNAQTQSCHLCVLMYLAYAKRTLDHRDPAHESLEDLSQDDQFHLRIAIVESKRNGYYLYAHVTEDIYFTVTIETDVETNLFGVGFPLVHPATASPMTFGIVGVWLKSCVETHPECKALDNGSGILPARLLDLKSVSTTGEITLRMTDSADVSYHYIALSHCWGKSEKLLLTKDTIGRFKTGIKLPELALTFREAIIAAAALGFRYLWIDCLCIIQDSEDDWNQESVKMASIYGNAVCTFAAAASPDSDGGCFRSRKPLELQPLRFESYPFTPNWAVDTSKPLLFCNKRANEAWEACKGPLDDRAWILQEQMLAPRTVHFAANQVLWECRKLAASEVWPSGVPRNVLSSFSEGKSKSIFDVTKFGPYEESAGFVSEDVKLKYHRWRGIVSMYSARRLTNAEDKLPAISGIATAFMSLANDRYLAGLWRTSLLEDLTWFVVPEYRLKNRLPMYIAPTWSWASVNTRVKFGTPERCTQDMEAKIHHAHVAIHQVHVTPLTSSLVGKVKAGYLLLTGSLRKSTWIPHADNPTKAKLQDELSQGWLNDEVVLYPDFDDTLLLSPEIYLFRLYRSHRLHRFASPVGRNCIHGLVLSPTDNEDEYRRVGYFEAADRGYTKLFRERNWRFFVEGWIDSQVTIV